MRKSPKKLPWLAAVVIAIIGLLVHGESQPEVAIPSSQVSKIKEAKGKSVSVSGRVAKANVSSSGTHFLNFAGTDFKVVCLSDLAKKFPSGGPAALYKDKDIVVKGVVELYKGSPQIKITSPDQVKVIGGSPNASHAKSDSGVASTAGPFKLKKLGNNTWESPIGLRYVGLDPQRKTRVEHIMRHAQDQPRRAGKHSVFVSNKEDEVFALIDQAWERAQQKKLRPKNEGGRSIYDVAMGRRVGYLGGQVGSRRNNPTLSKIRIVFETGTTNIVTAFPN
ncbi:MAG: hypothetical protein ACI8T1_003006 [Verrucomicrobiales bacterium]|jgi:hypothetical protein